MTPSKPSTPSSACELTTSAELRTTGRASRVSSVQQWQATGKYFEFARHRIFYQVEGAVESPVLILIHGYPSASWDWHFQWPTLVQHFRVITLDMLGFGFSDKPRNLLKNSNVQYSIHTQADIFSALLDYLGVTAVHILSHNYGDTVAQELLARSLAKVNITQRPSQQTIKVLSVCLLNGGLFPETHKALVLQKLLLSPIGSLIANLASHRKFKKNFDYICTRNLPAEEIKILWDLVNYNQGKPILAKLINYMRERKIFRERWVGALQNSDVPICLIDGLADPISGAHMVQRYRELILNPDVVELEDVGHYPQLEAPDEVLKYFLKFYFEKVKI